VAPSGEYALTPGASLGALQCAVCLSIKGAAADSYYVHYFTVAGNCNGAGSKMGFYLLE
jgi:hypothetical protein